MKNLFPYFLLIFPMFLFHSCSQTYTDKSGTEKGKPVAYSDTYKPHQFTLDNRREKIMKLAPQIRKMAEEFMEERHIPGIAYGIVIDDELVLASATGLLNLEDSVPATTKSAFRIASMTKSFTAMAILKLRDEGLLNLNDPVVAYIPEMLETQYLTSDSPPATIENLMTMTAGFPEDNPWGDRQLDEPDQMLIDLINEGIAFSNPPSYTFEYSNTGYAMLGLIISHVSGVPYQQYIKENILEPLGMNHTYWEFEDIGKENLAIGYRWEDDQWKLEPMLHDGSYGAMGGLITTIEDFSKYVSFHLSAWPPRSTPDDGPVKRSTLREMHTPQYPSLYSNAQDFEGEPCPMLSGYGYGLGIIRDCNGFTMVSHGGALPGFGSNYGFFPDYGIGIMAFGNLTYTRPFDRDAWIKLIFQDEELQPRTLPVSDILVERKDQIVDMIQHWDPEVEKNILADNFYLDRSRDHRMKEIKDILEKAGAIEGVDEISPENQLRGGFDLRTENGTITIFFTLSPEKDPKIQALYVSFGEKKQEEN